MSKVIARNSGRFSKVASNQGYKRLTFPLVAVLKLRALLRVRCNNEQAM